MPLTTAHSGATHPASRKPRERADCRSHSAPLKTCVLHYNRSRDSILVNERCVSLSDVRERERPTPPVYHRSDASSYTLTRRSMTGRDSEMHRDVPRCAERASQVDDCPACGDSEMIVPRCAEMCRDVPRGRGRAAMTKLSHCLYSCFLEALSLLGKLLESVSIKTSFKPPPLSSFRMT
jgi:hypothetical protein